MPTGEPVCTCLAFDDEFFLSNSFYHKFKLSNFRPSTVLGPLPFAVFVVLAAAEDYFFRKLLSFL